MLTRWLGPFSRAEVPGASRLLMDMTRLPGTSKHIIFLLLCQLSGESPHLLSREVSTAGGRLQVPVVSEVVFLFVTWDPRGHRSDNSRFDFPL